MYCFAIVQPAGVPIRVMWQLGRDTSDVDMTVGLTINANFDYHDSLFVCLFALRPKSTAMVIAGRSVHLTTLFPGQA